MKVLEGKHKHVLEEFKNKVDEINKISNNEGELLEKIESETVKKADLLQKKEEEKIKELSNLLIDIQLNKLEAKLTYIEEYEKILWQERKQIELFQRIQIAEKVNLAFNRLELQKQRYAQNNLVSMSNNLQHEGRNMTNNTFENVDDMLNFGIDLKNEDEIMKTDQL